MYVVDDNHDDVDHDDDADHDDDNHDDVDDVDLDKMSRHEEVNVHHPSAQMDDTENLTKH